MQVKKTINIFSPNILCLLCRRLSLALPSVHGSSNNYTLAFDIKYKLWHAMFRLHGNIGFEKAIKPITLEQKKMSDGCCKT